MKELLVRLDPRWFDALEKKHEAKLTDLVSEYITGLYNELPEEERTEIAEAIQQNTTVDHRLPPIVVIPFHAEETLKKIRENILLPMLKTCDQQLNIERQRFIEGIPLTSNMHQFRGTKPFAVYIPGKSPIIAPNWRAAASILIEDCASDPQRLAALMELRDKVFGTKNHPIISSKPDGMLGPFRVKDDLYIERYASMENLFSVLTRRVFDAVGYDYHGIKFSIVELHLGQTGLGQRVECMEEGKDQGLTAQEEESQIMEQQLLESPIMGS